VWHAQTLKTQYEYIVLELKKTQEMYSQRRGGMDFSWERKLTELIHHIVEYVSARREMMDLYPCHKVSLSPALVCVFVDGGLCGGYIHTYVAQQLASDGSSVGCGVKRWC